VSKITVDNRCAGQDLASTHRAVFSGPRPSRRHKERGNESQALWLLGEIAARRDPIDIEVAKARYGEALILATELGMRPLVAHCHLGLGKLYQRTGKREQTQERSRYHRDDDVPRDGDDVLAGAGGGAEEGADVKPLKRLLAHDDDGPGPCPKPADQDGSFGSRQA